MITSYREDASFLSPKDRILEAICAKLQLTTTQYKLANQHYESVGEWLEKDNSILALYNPKIYPQGSLPMGTTNKPRGREEYDLDFVCELSIPWQNISPNELVSKFEFRIREHKDYASRMERKNRCIRLTYAHDFHLDIVPACSNQRLGEGQILIPDREAQGWRHSNSKKFIEWFDSQTMKLLIAKHLDHAEPLPKQESLEEKAPLKFAVQLFKRYRDVAFKDTPELAPVSIVLSTLCATYYQGQESVFEAIEGILLGIAVAVEQNQGKRLEVWNPANQVPEDLGERWENQEAYMSFVKWIKSFKALWEKLKTARGYPNIGKILEALFDEYPTKEVIREDAERIEKLREKDRLGILPKSAILTSQTDIIKVPNNTFYGK